MVGQPVNQRPRTMPAETVAKRPLTYGYCGALNLPGRRAVWKENVGMATVFYLAPWRLPGSVVTSYGKAQPFTNSPR